MRVLPTKKYTQTKEVVTPSISEISLFVVSDGDILPYAALIRCPGDYDRELFTTDSSLEPLIWALTESTNYVEPGSNLTIFAASTRRDFIGVPAASYFGKIVSKSLADSFNPAIQILVDELSMG